MKGHHVLGIGFWIHDASENDEREMKSLIFRLIQRENRQGAKAEAKFIIQCIEEAFENPEDFAQIAKRIRFVSR